MFCKNCQQDTGNRMDCPHCGYNPVLDAEGAVAPPAELDNVQLPPVRIVLKKSSNGKANAALVLSFFAWAVIPGFLSFIFALVGFFQAKNCRSGRGKSIAAMCILAFWAWLLIMIVKSISG